MIPIGWMKTVRSLAALIVVAGLAWFVYDFYQRLDRRQAEEAAALRQQMQVLRRQADEMNRQLREVQEEAAALRQEREAAQGKEPPATPVQ